MSALIVPGFYTLLAVLALVVFLIFASDNDDWPSGTT